MKILNVLEFVLGLIAALFYGWLAQSRLIAGDEGFYLFAGKLVLNGQFPYLDFFYPQTPLIPVLVAGWFAIFGASWEAGRALCAVTAIISFVLVVQIVDILNSKRDPTSRSLGRILALIFVALSGLSLVNLSIAKGYTFAVLFLLLAVRLVLSGRCFWCGVAVALSFAVRAPLCVIGLPLLINCIQRKQTKAYLSGIFCGLLPVIALAAMDFRAFYFNNVEYHIQRSGMTFSDALINKWHVLSALLGIRESMQINDFSFLAGIALLLVVIISERQIIYRPLMIGLTVVLLVIHLLPAPIYTQYFVVLIPLFAILVGSVRSQVVAVIAVCVACFGLPLEVERVTKSGAGLTGIVDEENSADWQIEQVNRVCEVINKNIAPGDIVAALWPGYLVCSQGTSLAGLENQFALPYVRRNHLSATEIDDRNMISDANLNIAIAKHVAKVVVVRPGRINRSLAEVLYQSGYRVQEVGGHRIYMRFDPVS